LVLVLAEERQANSRLGFAVQIEFSWCVVVKTQRIPFRGIVRVVAARDSQ
jgi:hypothetical protein